MTGCFICPIYDQGRDFEFGYEFVESAIKFDLENALYFVFSTQAQQNKFLSECQRRFRKSPQGLIFDRDLSDCQNPVSIKKFYAIYTLKNSFDYIAAVDCESILTRSFDVGQLFDEIWKTGSCFASNLSIIGAELVLKCAAALGVEKNENVIRETGQYKHTWWFNEIPVYCAKDIEPFFQWLEKNDRLKTIYHDWNCFDYLVYGLWEIAEKDLNVKRYRVKCINGIIEALWRPEIWNKVGIEKKLGTHWTSREDCLHPVNEQICLQFHRDRRHLRFRQYLRRFYNDVFYTVKSCMKNTMPATAGWKKAKNILRRSISI